MDSVPVTHYSRYASTEPPKASICIVFHLDRIRNLPSNDFLPLIETVCRDQAPPFSEGATKRMSSVNRLGPRIDCFEAGLFVLSPIRD
jgi:hypothetical protein